MPVRISEKMMNSPNLIRSATRPDTIVAAVPAKASWKRKSTLGTSLPPVTISGVTVGSKNRPPNLNQPGITQLALYMIL